MNQQQEETWRHVVAFDFDAPMSEYSFSVRLAAENNWTRDFTEQAIKEYRKFMFIASQTDEMVSPSEVVDIVWHEHLVFTQSYHRFGEVLGKQVHHVPSTHNRTEFARFRDAKVLTAELYQGFFGERPRVIWDYAGMFDSLQLPKAKWKLRSFIIVGLMAFPPALLAFYFLLRPLYAEIRNPGFLFLWIVLAVITLMILEITNRDLLRRTFNKINRESFIYHLSAFEMLYLRSMSLKAPVLGAINNVLSSGHIVYDESERVFRKGSASGWAGKEEFQVIHSVGESSGVKVKWLLADLQSKPIFQNTRRTMTAFRKYFNKSVRFARIFYFNFMVLGVVLLMGATRVLTGLSFHRPVTYIVTATVVFAILVLLFLIRLARQVNFQGIPGWYNESLNAGEAYFQDPAWLFYLQGATVLAAPLAEEYRKPWESQDGGSSSSCGSSGGGDCGGSSCGSGGCGGCGGGD